MMDMATLKVIAENIILFGGAFMALYYGLKRVYSTARNVEKLVESSEQLKKSNEESREEIKKDFQHQNLIRDSKLDALNTALAELAGDLRAHVKMEEDRDLIRDQQLINLTDHMDEVIAEMRPNGGSSMKDILNATKNQVAEVHTRVAVLEQWKEDRPEVVKPKKISRMTRRSGRK